MKYMVYTNAPDIPTPRNSGKGKLQRSFNINNWSQQEKMLTFLMIQYITQNKSSRLSIQCGDSLSKFVRTTWIQRDIFWLSPGQ